MRVALLCDVDQTVYHVGDEAIALTSAEQLRRRGLEVTMISRQEKYGPTGAGRDASHESIRALTFPWPLEDRARYLDGIRAVLCGDMAALPPDDKAFGIIEHCKDMDALVIGGGGSLNSRFGWLLSERLATALVFASLGKPVLLTGQSLGPALSIGDRAALTELLGLCTLVGVRDADSYRLARRLVPDHPALFQTIDDAVLFDVDWDAPTADRISVTLGDDPQPFREDDYIRVLASLVDGLAERTGADIEFVPHMADPDSPASDVRMHELVAAQITHPSTRLPIEPAAIAAQRLAQSSWVLTTRFHPVVFGLLSASSIVPIGLGDYAISRIDGALRNWGWARSAVPFGALWDPDSRGVSTAGSTVLDAVVDAADSERALVRSRRAERVDAAAGWWDRVAATLLRSEELPAVAAPGAATSRFAADVADALTPITPWIPTDGPRSVAVIMRTRDRSDLLDRAVRDVLAQTYANWQLVVVDDAGDAAAVEKVLDRYREELADRLTVLHNPQSHGMEAASNLGLANSRSEFVVIHDDDDSWHPLFLQQTVAHLRSNPADQAVGVHVEMVHERQLGHDYVEYSREPLFPDMHAIRLVEFIRINRILPIALLYRRQVHDVIGDFDEDFPVIGDYDFILRLLEKFTIGFIDEPLAQWRLRPDSAGAASNSMFAQRQDHREYDLAMREEYLREWVSKNGLGLPLFVSKAIETETDRVDVRAARLEADVGQLLERVAGLEEQLRATDHAVRNGGGFNYAKRKYFAARELARRAGQVLHHES